jgi:xylulokinase
MNDTCVVVLDAGTSGLKAVAVSASGAILGHATVDYPLDAPQPGWAEQDAGRWWDAATAATRRLLASLPGVEVAGITVTNQQVTTVPVDGRGVPLAPAILWMDTRTGPLVRELQDHLGDEVLQTVGIPLSTSWAALRPLWWRRHMPVIHARAERFLFVDAFLYGHLCGRWVSDESNACFGPFDIATRRWSARLMDSTGIDPGTLPEVVPPGSVIGELKGSAAELMGLPTGIPVIAGASDQPSSAVGLGAIADGQVESTTGTGTFVIAHTSSPRPDPRTMTNCAAVPGRWVVYGVHYISGAILTWFRDQLFQAPEGTDAYEAIIAAAAATPAGAAGLVLLPYFQGARTPHFDDTARGVLYGLTLNHTSGHIARAILESNALGIRQILEVFADLGIAPTEIRIAGGGATSDLACRIQADVTGCEAVTTSTPETTALGAAILAWTALREYADVAEAVGACTKVAGRFLPDPATRDVYDHAYRTYTSLYGALREHFHRDASAGGGT